MPHHPLPCLPSALVWFRRDLRADDHAALFHALKAARQVFCVFVFDREILDKLPRADRRVEFIRDSLVDLDTQLRCLGQAHGVAETGLIVQRGDARDLIPALASQLGVQAVYANHDDEPDALARDATVRGRLAEAGVVLHTSKDVVVFERDEVLTATGSPYSVFTPYKNAWLKKLDTFYLKAYPVAKYAHALAPLPAQARSAVPTLAQIGFERTNLRQLKLPTGSTGARELLDDFLARIDDYAAARDFPAINLETAVGRARVGCNLVRGQGRARTQTVLRTVCAWRGAGRPRPVRPARPTTRRARARKEE